MMIRRERWRSASADHSINWRTAVKAIGHSTWSGPWKSGIGTMSTDTDTLKSVAFSFSSRFGGAIGASPEELLATAYAGCFNQALANNLGMIGLTAESVETSVNIEMGKDEDGHPAIVQLFVTTSAKVAGISQEQFDRTTNRARTHCSIAKLLRCPIGMTAALV